VSSQGLRLGELAERLGLRLEGDPDQRVSGVAGIEDAAADDLVYVRTAVYAAKLGDSPARAVVAPEGVDVGKRAALRSRDPGRDFTRAARIFVPEPEFAAGVHPDATVAAGACSPWSGAEWSKTRSAPRPTAQRTSI
jgi:UDP-3-O-[3-hydroxymyristoyl] glucosamine N-acyltransferase